MRAFQTFAFFGVDFFVPYAFNVVHGTSLALAGIAVTAATFSWTAGAWISERVLPRAGPRAQVRRGFCWIVVGNVLIADDKLYALGAQEGVLRLVKATPDSYQELAKVKVADGKEFWGTMALSDGKLVVRLRRSLKCFDVR